MPYKIEEHVGDKMIVQATSEPPMGPGFKREEIPAGAVRMEVWGSSFNDPGPDYCEFRLIDENGNILTTRRVDGY